VVTTRWVSCEVREGTTCCGGDTLQTPRGSRRRVHGFGAIITSRLEVPPALHILGGFVNIPTDLNRIYLPLSFRSNSRQMNRRRIPPRSAFVGIVFAVHSVWHDGAQVLVTRAGSGDSSAMRSIGCRSDSGNCRPVIGRPLTLSPSDDS
jgi:hypothetical protein